MAQKAIHARIPRLEIVAVNPLGGELQSVMARLQVSGLYMFADFNTADPRPPTAELVAKHPLEHATLLALVSKSLPTVNAAAMDKPALAPPLGAAVAKADGGAYRSDAHDYHNTDVN